MGVVQSFRSHGVDISLTEDDVIAAPDLDFVAILGVEQHPIVELHRAHVGADRNDLSPREAFAHLGRGRNQDSPGWLRVSPQ